MYVYVFQREDQKIMKKSKRKSKVFYFKDFTRETFDEMVAVRLRRRKPGLRRRVFSFIRQRDNYICQVCGGPEEDYPNIGIYYKDGDAQNLSYDNLECRCNDCRFD